MVIAKSPSKLSLPASKPLGVTTVLEFLILNFPAISGDVWQQRIANGKVHWHDGRLIHAHTPYAAQQRVYYYREVAIEPCIPFTEKIVFQDELILVAYKPPFLPVVPGGNYVDECLQNRLRRKVGNPQLQALHRIDRVTAGLVLFSVAPDTRQHYHRLFETRQVNKTYQGISRINQQVPVINKQWQIKNRIEKHEPKFLMHIVDGTANSHSRIRCLQHSSDNALFELHPITGKTHQLRLHMQSIGWPLLGDRYYPTLQAKQADNYHKPLQLLAQQLQFVDPFTKKRRHFSSDTELELV